MDVVKLVGVREEDREQSQVEAGDGAEAGDWLWWREQQKWEDDSDANLLIEKQEKSNLKM